jgi:hypothetical protein
VRVHPEIKGFFGLEKYWSGRSLVVNTASRQESEKSRYPADDITNRSAADLLRVTVGADIDYEITHLVK